MFSTQDIRDIFAAVETETDEEELPFVLAALSATPGNDPSSSIVILLNPDAMLPNFFKHRQDVLGGNDQVRIKRFKDAATFTTILCLLMHKPFDERIHHEDLGAVYLAHSNKLAAMSQSLFTENSLGVLRYFLFKILQWKQDNLSSSEAIRKTIDSILYDLCNGIHAHITAGKATDAMLNIHVEYINRMFKNHENADPATSTMVAIKTKYIVDTQRYYLSQTNPTNRCKVLGCIYETWALLGSAVTLKNIGWLQIQSDLLMKEHLSSRHLSQKIIDEMTQYYLYVTENPWTIAGLAFASANFGCFAYQLKSLLGDASSHLNSEFIQANAATDPILKLALTLAPLVIGTLCASKTYSKIQSTQFFRRIDKDAPKPLPEHFIELKSQLENNQKHNKKSSKRR